MYQLDFSNPTSIHFIGIGGISMSGLAEILLGAGFDISGSDMKPSELTQRLTSLGASISYPQAASNVSDSTAVFVYTAAIHEDNPEFMAAKATGKPMLSRADLLGQIMENYSRSIAVAGTHGKTTTTSMISEVLLAGEADPTISVGGILPSINSNIHVGDSDLFITEACEYTNSYHSFYPRYNVILNIEEDHMDFFKDLADIRASFRRFAQNTKQGGALVINSEIPDLDEIVIDLDCKVITFSATDSSADFTATDISYNELGCASFSPVRYGTHLPRVTLGVPGAHNIGNALSCIAISMEMGISFDQISAGLTAFGGADRRFQYKGNFQGATVIDDYAHHPTEIRASLAAAANYPHNRTIVVFQPHTYTRTQAFLADFADALSSADIVILAEIYAAREENIYGISSKDILSLLQEKSVESYYFATFGEIEDFLKKISQKNDLLITMGAGDVVNIGEDLLKE